MSDPATVTPVFESFEPTPSPEELTDIVVIGSGIGGLCCAALLAQYGFAVTVCESPSIAGGASHSFSRNGYTFDSGPSLHSGLSDSPSAHPLKQVLDAIGETVPCLTYDTWGCYLPEGELKIAVGADPFCEVLQELRGRGAVQEWRKLQQVMEPLAAAAKAIASARFAPAAIAHLGNIVKLTGPFSRVMDEVIQDPFIRNWLDLLCFLLSGLPASGTSAAEMAFMFAQWYRPGVVLEYPIAANTIAPLNKHLAMLKTIGF